ncbi:MAG: nicotinamide riboside transporter PnuC [Pseudomonadota bacterium]
MTIQDFVSGFLGASSIEIIASISGFICVFLIIKRNIWCWFFGFIQVTLFTHVFFESKLYSNAGLHVIYMFLQIYGWWNWRHHRDSEKDLIVEHSGAAFMSYVAASAVLSTLLLGYIMQTYTNANMAFLDAFIACTSLIAQVLLTRRYWFNWVLWICVNVVSIYVYFQQGLYPTVLLYSCFLIMCLFGVTEWLKKYRAQLSLVSSA